MNMVAKCITMKKLKRKVKKKPQVRKAVYSAECFGFTVFRNKYNSARKRSHTSALMRYAEFLIKIGMYIRDRFYIHTQPPK